MKIKMCGLRRIEDIQYANEVHPDYVGFVFADSKRKVTSQQAKIFRQNLKESIKAVGVFVNEPLESVISIVREVPLDVVQLHGDEGATEILELKKALDVEIWKAVRVKASFDVVEAQELPADKLLLDSFSMDSYGGTGKVMDMHLIQEMEMKKPFFIAGGLNIENTEDIIEQIQPYGIDISSGIETNQRKDLEKMKMIMEIAGGRDE